MSNPDSSPQSLFEVDRLCKSYGNTEHEISVLAQLRLQVRRGEFLAVMGASGSGKSTLLHILGCLDRPTSGSYVFDGKRVDLMDDAALCALRAEEVGFIFQKFHLLPRLTVYENLEITFQYTRVPQREQRPRILEALAEVGLSHRLGHLPGELSGGEVQRVAIARALVKRPGVLLADEPTGSLDPSTAAGVLELLERIHSKGATLVLVTHDPKIAARADRTVYLRGGRLDS